MPGQSNTLQPGASNGLLPAATLATSSSGFAHMMEDLTGRHQAGAHQMQPMHAHPANAQVAQIPQQPYSMQQYVNVSKGSMQPISMQMPLQQIHMRLNNAGPSNIVPMDSDFFCSHIKDSATASASA